MTAEPLITTLLHDRVLILVIGMPRTALVPGERKVQKLQGVLGKAQRTLIWD